jgi:5,10-methylene-tetrahydrofolate dehydrogenase/methenyl tetrahydrofolate cyclohydrolase
LPSVTSTRRSTASLAERLAGAAASTAPKVTGVAPSNNPESELYVRLKKKACEQMGIEYVGSHLKEDIS